jgi:hypothetical protein
MNDSHRRRIERLMRSEANATANAADFPEGSKGALALTDLRAFIAEAQAHAVSRESSVSALQQATIGRGDAREAVRASMRIISDTVHTISLDHPEFKGSFVFKGASVSDRTLLATAQSFALMALPLRALFNEYDLNADFFSGFDAEINSLEQQLNKQTSDKGERISANASLENALRNGEIALERLDTAVRNKYRNDPVKLAAWESARHLERAARTKRSGETPPTPKTS